MKLLALKVFDPFIPRLYGIGALLLLCLNSSLLAVSEAAKPVTASPLIVAIDDNYPPYIFRDTSGGLNGYLVDLWALWSSKTGITVELLASDWKTAQQQMFSHQATVIDTVFQTPERDKFLDFSPAYAQIPVTIYTHTNIGGITKAEDLQGFLVGVKAGDACINTLEQAGVTDFKPYADYELIVNAALKGEIRIFCLDEPPANYLLYKSHAETQFRKAFQLNVGKLHRAVHKGDAATLALLNQGFSSIPSAELKALNETWMGTPIDSSNLSSYLRYLVYALPALVIIGILLLLWGATLRCKVRLRTAELEAERTRQRMLLEATPDLVWMKDKEGVFRFCNPQFERLFGTSEANIVGKTDYDFVDNAQADSFRAHDQLAIAADTPLSNEESLTFADTGQQILVETTKTSVRDDQGQVIGVLGIAHNITARKQAEQALQESEYKLHTILDSVEACIYIKDSRYRYQYANKHTCELFGKTLDGIIDCEDSDFFTSETATNQRINDRRVIELGERVALEEINTNAADLSTNTFMSVKLPLRDKDGTIYALCGISTDITNRKQTESSLRIAAAAFESQQGMLITDAHNRILRANQSFIEMSGYSAEEIDGQSPSMFASGQHDAAFYDQMWGSINASGSWQGEIWDKRKSGEIYPKWLSITAVKGVDAEVTHYIATQTDITERKAAEEQILNLAFYDPLTGLPNRRLLTDRLQLALASSTRSGYEGALLLIDLDYFKTLNDTLGHDKGDMLLVQTAERISHCVREEDTVARLGGDEFVVMLKGLSAERLEAARQTKTVATKILDAISRPHDLDGQEYLGSASIGITLFSADDNLEELMKRADMAMYNAKAAGRNGLCFFDPAMQAEITARVALEAELRSALRLQQFVLYYQPQLDSQGQTTGAEALVRWQHAERGLVPPVTFIPLAEETGLILPLGSWVLETACHQLNLWSTDPTTAKLVLAVNVSAGQLHQDDFVEQVVATLEQTGVNPCRLKLEITESHLLDNIEDCITKMNRLRALGVRFSLDDFGTGYSSLTYLKRLPLEQLKIDQSFVRDVVSNPNDAAIARTIVALAHSLSLNVIAEGVETQEQRDFLAENDCHAYQGYLFSRPLPIAEFGAFLLAYPSQQEVSVADTEAEKAGG